MPEPRISTSLPAADDDQGLPEDLEQQLEELLAQAREMEVELAGASRPDPRYRPDSPYRPDARAPRGKSGHGGLADPSEASDAQDEQAADFLSPEQVLAMLGEEPDAADASLADFAGMEDAAAEAGLVAENEDAGPPPVSEADGLAAALADLAEGAERQEGSFESVAAVLGEEEPLPSASDEEGPAEIASTPPSATGEEPAIPVDDDDLARQIQDLLDQAQEGSPDPQPDDGGEPAAAVMTDPRPGPAGKSPAIRSAEAAPPAGDADEEPPARKEPRNLGELDELLATQAAADIAEELEAAGPAAGGGAEAAVSSSAADGAAFTAAGLPGVDADADDPALDFHADAQAVARELDDQPERRASARAAGRDRPAAVDPPKDGPLRRLMPLLRAAGQPALPVCRALNYPIRSLSPSTRNLLGLIGVQSVVLALLLLLYAALS